MTMVSSIKLNYCYFIRKICHSSTSCFEKLTGIFVRKSKEFLMLKVTICSLTIYVATYVHMYCIAVFEENVLQIKLFKGKCSWIIMHQSLKVSIS